MNFIKNVIKMDNQRLLDEITSVRLKCSRAVYELHTLKEKVKVLEAENQNLHDKITKMEQNKNDVVENMQANEDKSLEKHISELKIHQDVEEKPIKQSISHRSEEKMGDVYEVEKLLDHKKRGSKILYLVRWKGFDSDEDSWEPESNLRCRRILQAYRKKNNIIK